MIHDSEAIIHAHPRQSLICMLCYNTCESRSLDRTRDGNQMFDGTRVGGIVMC